MAPRPETSNMRRDFADRNELVKYLAEQFPDIAARGIEVSSMRGGRSQAIEALQRIDPIGYGRNRNFLSGAVSRLSPYIRHGVLTLAEVRDVALARARDSNQSHKFVQELGWRDYWQRVYAQIGDGVWMDREPYKTGFSKSEYAQNLPDDVAKATTGLACMDGFSADLRSSGYLHNHARMWIAAYLVHWRKVRWQAGARWFLQHLLDGDPASNNLSWQWVASTNSWKPYIFNRDNLERFTEGRYCCDCPVRDRCPFDGSYEVLSLSLFPNLVRDQSPHKQQGKV